MHKALILFIVTMLSAAPTCTQKAFAQAAQIDIAELEAEITTALKDWSGGDPWSR